MTVACILPREASLTNSQLKTSLFRVVILHILHLRRSKWQPALVLPFINGWFRFKNVTNLAQHHTCHPVATYRIGFGPLMEGVGIRDRATQHMQSRRLVLHSTSFLRFEVPVLVWQGSVP